MLWRDLRQRWSQASPEQWPRRFIRKQRIQQRCLIDLEERGIAPHLNAPGLPLPLDQRVAHILRQIAACCALQHLLNLPGMQPRLDSARDAGLRQPVLRDMFQADALGEAIKADEQCFGDGSQSHQFEIWLYNESSQDRLVTR